MSIILSNFHAFKDRKFMMNFLVGSYTLQFSYLSWHCTEKQCSDHWHTSLEYVFGLSLSNVFWLLRGLMQLKMLWLYTWFLPSNTDLNLDMARIIKNIKIVTIFIWGSRTLRQGAEFCNVTTVKKLHTG